MNELSEQQRVSRSEQNLFTGLTEPSEELRWTQFNSVLWFRLIQKPNLSNFDSSSDLVESNGPCLILDQSLLTVWS